MTYPGDHDVRTQEGPVQSIASQTLAMVVLENSLRQPIRYVASYGKVRHVNALVLFVFSHHDTSGDRNHGGGNMMGDRSMTRMITSYYRIQGNDNPTSPLCAHYKSSGSPKDPRSSTGL